jgi:hypothetical protein
MELDEVIMIRSNFDYYSKNFLDYTDIDVAFAEGRITNQAAVNDLTWAAKISPVTEGIFHSGEKTAKIALERLKKLK